MYTKDKRDTKVQKEISPLWRSKSAFASDPQSLTPIKTERMEFDPDGKEEILAEWNASGGYDADPDDYRNL
ncbi:hypothetical protein MBM_03806 [Drepanopeziza brunnea f. sp. 'multigermtubi' MB_m1]|uniref:Uncharacterized protein n=1 Tax=Marssonina brunnea f. sp. multigermtubi (strain MB_m1) TaxID=1072389 RepID=K1XYX0_MARBU|nr:uncharacterized protein MBM_03806 [Drepanopeziza brunnea f. sp. 'multigermtubi' MB_m1]EKD18034.1 hypothetical protein MBM_03806 [Drepanopeziza brunnea f. sp. 'multigermtubi' MB_m1]